MCVCVCNVCVCVRARVRVRATFVFAWYTLTSTFSPGDPYGHEQGVAERSLGCGEGDGRQAVQPQCDKEEIHGVLQLFVEPAVMA